MIYSNDNVIKAPNTMRILISLLFLAVVLWADAQTMVIHHKDGTTTQMGVEGIDSITFLNESPVPEPQYKAVDLGLSVLWAEVNVGAETPYDYGNYYSWGEVTAKDDYSEESYLYFVNERYENIGRNISGTKYDVARQEWGGNWRMPTVEEIEELSTKCTWTWTETAAGVRGYTVTGTNGNSIFLPAAGYNASTSVTSAGSKGFYWAGTLSDDYDSAAYNLNFSGYSGRWSANRSYGLTIRGVK